MDRNSLAYWKKSAKSEIYKWLIDEEFRDKISAETLKDESLGPFTKFLYYFGAKCQCGWGTMLDFDERKQRVFLTDRYYKWMHKLRDEINEELEKLRALS
jgi:hypothetical protein